MTGPTSLAVVKVGGSLFGWPELPGRLIAFLEARRAIEPTEAVILIAGGGPAADWIRSLDQVYRLGDEAAHGLALHALALTAATLTSLLPRSIMVDRLDMLAAAGCRNDADPGSASRAERDRTPRHSPASGELGCNL